jgi:hypothetical protein
VAHTWFLTAVNLNEIQVESIQRMIERAKSAHHVDVVLRVNGHEERFEADWLKWLKSASADQETESC